MKRQRLQELSQAGLLDLRAVQWDLGEDRCSVATFNRRSATEIERQLTDLGFMLEASKYHDAEADDSGPYLYTIRFRRPSGDESPPETITLFYLAVRAEDRPGYAVFGRPCIGSPWHRLANTTFTSEPEARTELSDVLRRIGEDPAKRQELEDGASAFAVHPTFQ